MCLCADIPVVQARTRIVIIRHHTERFRSSNSGRLAHLALPNSVIHDYGGPIGTAQVPPLDPRAWLLWPEGEPTLEVTDPPEQLVVLDATWSQARRMYRKLPVRGMRLLRLPEAPMPEARMRASPAPDRVSTIEAIARALRLLEGEAVAAPLEALFALAVARAAATGRNV